MWNTMECKRDSFSDALGGTREMHWERVSHALKFDLKFDLMTINSALTSHTYLPNFRSISRSILRLTEKIINFLPNTFKDILHIHCQPKVKLN